MPESERIGASPPPAASLRRSKTVNTLSCLAGLAAAGVGIVYVLRHAAHAIDIVLIVGGLLVAGMALYLRVRSPAT